MEPNVSDVLIRLVRDVDVWVVWFLGGAAFVLTWFRATHRIALGVMAAAVLAMYLLIVVDLVNWIRWIPMGLVCPSGLWQWPYPGMFAILLIPLGVLAVPVLWRYPWRTLDRQFLGMLTPLATCGLNVVLATFGMACVQGEGAWALEQYGKAIRFWN